MPKIIVVGPRAIAISLILTKDVGVILKMDLADHQNISKVAKEVDSI